MPMVLGVVLKSLDIREGSWVVASDIVSLSEMGRGQGERRKLVSLSGQAV